jgi:hypothetical protein
VDENPKELDPVLKEFQTMVERDARLRMLFTAMFDQVGSDIPERVHADLILLVSECPRHYACTPWFV